MNPSLRAAAAAATLGSGSSTPCFDDASPSLVEWTQRSPTTGSTEQTRNAPVFPPLHSPPADQRSLWLTTHIPAVSADIFLTALACQLYVFTICLHHQVTVGAKSHGEVLLVGHRNPANASGCGKYGRHE